MTYMMIVAKEQLALASSFAATLLRAWIPVQWFLEFPIFVTQELS
jgi:hypothetical protein